MTASDRRTFLRGAAAAAAAAALPQSIHRALALPANNRNGSIEDVEHIIFLMQENRSFDHYFGTLQGVRGYGDPRAVNLASGAPVWQQPDHHGSGSVLPFHPKAPDLGLQFLEDLPHDWASTHAAWNKGRYDKWVPSKGPTTMAYLTRNDIPFHYALADAFTVCDAYHCSLLGPTDPNRYHMFTGWVGNDGAGGGPVIDNAEAGYGWSTFPERLQRAGITWKVYQDSGVGLNAAGYWGWTEDAYIGNYGDNSLLYFHQYQDAPDSSPLAQKARTGTNISAGGTLFDVFLADIANDTLPQVSWIVAPEAYCEHPNWPVNYGAWYIAQILDALTANPALWSKTAIFLTYDENDGFFDHMVPPTPPQNRAEGLSTVPITNEIYPGSSEYEAGPYGLGVRVPMIVISPWSKGGWVNSQLFDHTSLIRFVEQRFGRGNPDLTETNITQWRRAVCGDLTGAFDFATPNAAVVSLPPTAAYQPPDQNRHPDYKPHVPAEQSLPAQEPGVRRARALPYLVDAWAAVQAEMGAVRIEFLNGGAQAAVLQVRSGDPAVLPRGYTLDVGRTLSDHWAVAAHQQNQYDLSVYGPNGFFRGFKGSVSGSTAAALAVRVRYDVEHFGLALDLTNHGTGAVRALVQDVYSGAAAAHVLQPGQSVSKFWSLQTIYGWYDVIVTVDSDPSFQRHLAGHLENGQDSITDPAIGGWMPPAG